MLRKIDLKSHSLSMVGNLFMIALFAVGIMAQQPQPSPEDIKPGSGSSGQANAGNITAEQIAELSVAIYGFPSGRATLDQLRKTFTERGKVAITGADGRTENATYQRWFSRDEQGLEKQRIDQQFPNARFSLIRNSSEIFGIFNESSFVPRDDASTSFRNQLDHSIDAFLRYKENESTLSLAGREKILGVEYHLIDMTDKNGNKTRYFVSVRSFRVMMLEYESGGSPYRRKFYDYRYAQGTLVPYRSVLSSGERTLEEVQVGTITFGQKVDDGLFVKP